jgi:lysophospholipase L1-like esterase
MSDMHLLGGIVVALAGFALLFELGLRSKLGAPWAERLPTLRVRPDPHCGYRPVPGDVHYGYRQLTKLNNLGLRGPDVEDKKQGEHRIVVVGDSIVFGIGLSDDDLLTTVLEQELNRREPCGRFRAVNLGVRGFALNQQLALFEVLAGDLKPDHVIVVFGLHSFSRANIAKFYGQIRKLDWYMPDLDGKPTRTAVFRWRCVWLARKSATVAWVYRWYKYWRRRNEVPIKLLHGTASGDVEQGLGFVQQQLDRFKAVAGSHGADFSVAVVPFEQQLAHDYPANRYQSALREITAALDVPSVDLLPELRDLYRKTGRLPAAPFDEHYNAAAHRVMAMQLVDHLHACAAQHNGDRASALR